MFLNGAASGAISETIAREVFSPVLMSPMKCA
jgi:hypothetical protein